MTRKEILEMFEVNEHGIITSPGKYENGMLYVPYFWDMVINGFGEENGELSIDYKISRFIISDEDRKEFPELENAKTIDVWVDDYGFCYAELDAIPKE